MRYSYVCKMELYKLLKKKTSWLLLIVLGIPILFGIGMTLGLVFQISDGSSSFDVISTHKISALDFAVDMFSKSTYIIYFLVIILSSLSLSSELEHGQLRNIIVRICDRRKIIIAKYISLLLVVALAIVFFFLTSFLAYFALVENTSYGNGLLFGDNHNTQILSVLFNFLGISSTIAFTMFIGLKFKTFLCFSMAYIIWFSTKYLEFFETIKLLSPDQFAHYVLNKGISNIPLHQLAFYLILFLMYGFVFLLMSITKMNRMDIK